MKILGIKDGHDPSVVLMIDGTVVYGLQEERLTRQKSIAGFPRMSLLEILKQNGLEISDIDCFAMASKISGVFTTQSSREGNIEKYKWLFNQHRNRQQPSPLGRVVMGVRSLLSPEKPVSVFDPEANRRVRIKPLLELGIPMEKVKFYDHHECHAACPAYGWGIDEPCLVVTADGHGDGISGSLSRFDGLHLERLAEIEREDSLAKVYGLVTYSLGMVPLEHEYKIMGMAPYAEEAGFSRQIADELLGLFEFDQDGLRYRRKPGVEPVWELGARLDELFRHKRFDYVCAGVQIFIEEFASEWVRRALETTGLRKVAMGGGLFMNVKLNKRIMELDLVDDMFVFPSCGDETASFGAAYSCWVEETGTRPTPLQGMYMGDSFSDEAVKQALDKHVFQNGRVESMYYENIEEEVAKLLAEGEVVARFKGRMEFGARALGNRSIIADPANQGIIKRINKMIKCRDFWMPFAPSMVDANRYVQNEKGIRSPYMILTMDSKEGHAKNMPAAMHPYDETCRPQDVYEEWNPDYYRLIRAFEKHSGYGVVLNTSFNLHGHPIVHTPKDALEVLDASGLTHLAIGNYLVRKTDMGN